MCIEHNLIFCIVIQWDSKDWEHYWKFFCCITCLFCYINAFILIWNGQEVISASTTEKNTQVNHQKESTHLLSGLGVPVSCVLKNKSHSNYPTAVRIPTSQTLHVVSPLFLYPRAPSHEAQSSFSVCPSKIIYRAEHHRVKLCFTCCMCIVTTET